MLLRELRYLFCKDAPKCYTKENTSKKGGLNMERDGKHIAGKLYLPESVDNPPLVILSHGFGANYKSLEGYAHYFVDNGFAAYVFDFIGGGLESQSDGKMTDMSVLTEAADLGVVLDYFQDFSDINNQQIFLFGASQGGFVSTYVAGTRPDDIAGLIVLYPAYVLQDDSKKRNPNPELGSETSHIGGIEVGKIYDRDAQSFDIYDLMPYYHGKTLIIHGTSDPIVPISYSERAVATFPEARLVVINGAGHGFTGKANEIAKTESVDFIKNIIAEK